MQEHGSAFDLNAMMTVTPMRGFMPTESICHINRIPNEALGYIFDALSSQFNPPSMKVPLTLSHVCSRWRAVIITTSSHWTYLTFSNTDHSEIFADFVSRSRHRSYVLRIDLPSFDLNFCKDEQQKEFRKTFIVLKKSAQRLRELAIVSNNPTLWHIFNKILRCVDLPLLESLTIEQVNPKAKRFRLGALNFNPATFHKLVLKNIAVDSDAPRFAGLRTLHLINSSGTLLDQRQLRHSTYPAIPEEPVMMNLEDLIIDGTNMVITDELFTPSLLGSSLRNLHLANISIESDEAHEATMRLFHVTYGPRLLQLICQNLDTAAFRAFITLTTAGPEVRYPHVRRLVLAGVDIGDVGHRFLQAFPAVTTLSLYDTRQHRIMNYLIAQEIMPLLEFVDLMGHIVPRPRLRPALPIQPINAPPQ